MNFSNIISISRRLAAAVGATTIAATATVFSATPANAAVGNGTCDSGEFCAFKNTNYGTILLESKAKNANKVDVQDDVVSSIKNRTTWKCVAVDGRTALPDRKKDLAASTSWSALDSDWDNKINHFEAKS